MAPKKKITGLVVAEEELVDALAVSALKLAVGADGLVGGEVGPDAAGLRQLIAVVHLGKK
jgi:hypothetical protein